MPAISQERRERYASLFGADFWELDVPGWRMVAINAQLLGSRLTAADEQLDFVSAAFAGAGTGSIALLVHKPLFHLSPDEDAITGRFVNPSPRRQLLEAFAGRTPKLVVSGHVHQHFSNRTPEGTEHVWAPSTAFVLPNSRQPVYGRKEVGYVEHELMPDGSHASRFLNVAGLATNVISDFPEAYGPL